MEALSAGIKRWTVGHVDHRRCYKPKGQKVRKEVGHEREVLAVRYY